MFVAIDLDRCAGCGICVDECPNNAISLVDGWAVIDQTKCSGCLTCVEACPNEAIQPVAEPQPVPGAITPRRKDEWLPAAPVRAAMTAPSKPSSRVAPLTGAALAYLGGEVLPRVIDIVMTALENCLVKPQDERPAAIHQEQTGVDRPGYGRGRGKQIRRRQGHRRS